MSFNRQSTIDNRKSLRRKQELKEWMAQVRARTLWLLDQVPDRLLKIRVHDFYSPVGWHFGHIAMTEEFWVMTQALHRPCHDPDYAFLFANIPENPKDNRIHLPGRERIQAYLAQTCERTMAALDETDLATEDPLLADGYAWDFAQQHECQHQETILEMLQLLCKHSALEQITSTEVSSVLDPIPPTEMVEIPGGTFLMGCDDRHAYDNEKRAHEVEVAPFKLDKTPVTASQWVQFIQDGGYQRPELWTPEGWDWRQKEKAEAPEYWFQAGKGYGYYGANGARGIGAREPVTSISWFEADAFARWIGKRLPTEAEWEYATAYDPVKKCVRRYPWGDGIDARRRADLDFQARSLDPLPISHGRSASGVDYMAGKVWQWTSTPFLPYPGFKPFPYDGYSKDHMDGRHYVCRGGSWASDARILRCSFRNWYVPTYRQGFLGLRCAR